MLVNLLFNQLGGTHVGVGEDVVVFWFLLGESGDKLFGCLVGDESKGVKEGSGKFIVLGEEVGEIGGGEGRRGRVEFKLFEVGVEESRKGIEWGCLFRRGS